MMNGINAEVKLQKIMVLFFTSSFCKQINTEKR